MQHLKKFFRWHLLLWLAYFGYVVVGEYGKGHTAPKDLWFDVSFMAARIATFYFGYLLVFPRLLRTKRLPLLVLGLLGAGVVFASVRGAFEEKLYPLLLGFDNYDDDTPLYQFLIDGTYYALPNLVLSAALWASETALRRERENQQLAREKHAAELAFLKAQINPHFLYNTLNMLYGLAYGVDKALASGLLKLSELMRYMLRDTPDGRVDLAEEVEYLENFLDLYHLRYPGRLHAALAVTGAPAGYRVAPLLLIPFVENAFKHGVLDDPTTPVRMRLTLTPEAVEFIVENQRHDYQTASGSGVGLANLHRRLELLYPGQYTWQVGPVGAQFRAQLRLAVPMASAAAAVPVPLHTEVAAALAVVSAG